MSDAAAIADLAHELRIPDDAAGFRDIIDALPELIRMQAGKYADLAEALSEQAGPGVQQTVEALHELADALSDAVTPAEQAAVSFGEEAGFWLSGS